jgi:tRNA dimethylallyltransferase
MEQQLIVIQGPTASGKTVLAAELAKTLGTVVISADSRQFYKELSIGTAKPSPEEMDGVKHYFIDSHSILEPVSAAQFEKEALSLIENDLSDHKYIVVAGGSGMFIDALCIGLDPIPADPEIQRSLRKELEENGLAPLLNELMSCDPEYFEEVDRMNPPRILRALEVYRSSGIPFSHWRKNKPEPRPFGVQRFTIEHPRETLYERIDSRVEKMMREGLLEEARSVHHLKELPALQTVGYKECFDFFEGKCTLSECVDKIAQHTRNYAKRQLTWFKRHPGSIPLPFTDTSTMAALILGHIRGMKLE